VKRENQRRIGLARALSKLGYCSRSQAIELIREGRVRLNRKIRRDAEFPVVEDRDEISVDGKIAAYAQKIYLMMNKPRGVVTTASDEKGRATVYDLLASDALSADRDASNRPWIAPIGRLDKASEGLLLFTNDSEWAAKIAAPETHLDKTYHVQIARLPDQKFLATLTAGVLAGNGEILRAKRARILRAGEKNSWIEIVLDEGRNRHIRRMMEALGVEVLRLLRVAIGPLQLSELAKGQHRELTSHEKNTLDRTLKRNAAGLRTADLIKSI
jgi:23S rRNA pseudouridine2605 synthase